MGLPQYLQLQDAVLSRDYSSNDRNNVKAWINSANQELHAAYRWSWAEMIATISTVAGTETVALPTSPGVLWVGRIRPNNTTTPQVEYLDPGNINSDSPLSTFNPTADSRGAPRYVTRYGNTLYFDPTPDAVFSYRLYYWGKATALSADGDEPLAPEDDREILVYGALQRAAERDRDLQMANYWRGQWDRKLDEMRAKDNMLLQGTRRVPMPKSYYGRYDRG